MTVSRRTFLTRSAQLWAAMHLPLLHAAAQEKSVLAAGAPVQFDEVTLQAHYPQGLMDFYRIILDMPVEYAADGVIIRAGSSRLKFTQAPAGLKPFYHFAFNIPENQFNEAKAWLSGRVPLLAMQGTGKTTVEFKAWNAHAMYFHDPAGNIVELIARHDLDNASGKTFGPEQLLNVSEIGLVTADVPALSDRIQRGLGLSVYKRATPTFTPVGNEHGLFILAQKDRPWFPERRISAETHPVGVLMGGAEGSTLDLSPLPFRVKSA